MKNELPPTSLYDVDIKVHFFYVIDLKTETLLNLQTIIPKYIKRTRICIITDEARTGY